MLKHKHTQSQEYKYNINRTIHIRKIKHQLISSQLKLYNTPKKDINIIHNQQEKYHTPVIGKSCILKEINSNRSLNQSIVKNRNILTNLSQQIDNNIIGRIQKQLQHKDTFKENLEKNVYKERKELLNDLEKAKLQKRSKNVKEYQQSLLNPIVSMFSIKGVKQLKSAFKEIKKTSDTNIKSNINFIRFIERKEKRIISKINHNQDIFTKILKNSGHRFNSFELRKIRFIKVLND